MIRGMAESVFGYAQRRASTLARLKQAQRALDQWDEYLAETLFPPDVPRRMREPLASRESIASLIPMLVAQLQEIEEERERVMWDRRQ
jgi:hypothetical protein